MLHLPLKVAALLACCCCCCALAVSACKAGASKFVLTAISGGQQCASTELAVLWPFININQTAVCNYTYSGMVGSPYVYPVTFAPVTYPTRLGSSRRYVKFTSTSVYVGSNEYTFYEKFNNTSQGWIERTLYRPATFDGFLEAWTYYGLPIYFQGPFGLDTNVPGNYTAKAAGRSSFVLLSKDTGCSFRYRIVSGEFAGFTPTACSSSSGVDCPTGSTVSSTGGSTAGSTAGSTVGSTVGSTGGNCGPGRYRQKQALAAGSTAANSFVCALCPAGSYSADGQGVTCSKCSGRSAAPQAGAVSCLPCDDPLISSYQGDGATACMPQCDRQQGYDLPTWGMNVVYRNGQACDVLVCPNGIIATPNNDCLAAQNGQLCVSVAATGNSTCNSAKPASTDKEQQTSTATEGWGGAVLKLETAETTAAVCSTGLSELAEWLKTKQTWLGFNLTAWGATFEPGGVGGPVFGLQWQVMGPLTGSNIRQFPRCGLAHGGPGPLPWLTQGPGTVLDTTALAFQSILKTRRLSSNSTADPVDYSTSTWRVLVSKGAGDNNIKTVWVRDGSVGQCPTVTSLAVRETAGGDLAEGSCQLNFKVVSGSILGAAAAAGSACTAGTYKVKHPGGATSCVACPPGFAISADGSSCSQCRGNTFTDVWGATVCLPCDQPDYDHAFCYASPTA